MKTTLGGMVSAIAPDAANNETSSPGFMPRAFISGNKTGATAAMSAALAPDMPETRYIAPRSTSGKATTNMAEQRCEEANHCPGHACHVDQDAEKHE